MTAIPPSEASCLLVGGTLYRTRVGLRAAQADGPLVFAGFKKGAFSIYFGDAPIYHFDLEGRWQRAYVEPTHFLKGLDTDVHAIDRFREGANLVLRRRVLDAEESRALDQQVRAVALGLFDELERGQLERTEPPAGRAEPLDDEMLRGFLARIAGWDAAAWAAHRTAYHETYRALPFLPPACQNAVVLQATVGDAGGTPFGGGPAVDDAARTPEEFGRHIDQVLRLLGRRLLQCRVVFLAGSDVLKRSPEDVLKLLGLIVEKLPVEPGPDDSPDVLRLEGTHVLLDDFSAPLPGPEALRLFRARSLTHLSLGVASGDPAIRGRYGRSWNDADLRQFTADAKSAGIRLSLLTFVGAGGPRQAERHVSGTAELLGSLALSRGDSVFLLDEGELHDDGAPEKRDQWSRDAWLGQQAELKEALAPLRQRGVKVLPYSLEKQWG